MPYYIRFETTIGFPSYLCSMQEFIKPTVEWMSRTYNELNQLYFDGILGPCLFETYSKSTWHGYFVMSGKHIHYNKRDRRLFKETMYDGNVYINKRNFFELCKPKILLNLNYNATEESYTETMLHEMCHYYTYMNGYVPKQAHGVDFKQIAAIVSAKSNGRFNISTYQDENMKSQTDLSDDMKAKIRKQAQSVKSVFVVKDDNYQLTLTRSEDLIGNIVRVSRKRGNKVLVSDDPRLSELLLLRYKRVMRTWKCWEIPKDAEWLDLNKYNFRTMNESVMDRLDVIVEEQINKFVNKISNDEIGEINPNMNLSELSPIEAQ